MRRQRRRGEGTRRRGDNEATGREARDERGRRQQKRRDAALGDIKEDPNAPSHGGRDDLETHEVIFHITGGGWFIHTTATDLPYLSEWSANTNSIIGE